MISHTSIYDADIKLNNLKKQKDFWFKLLFTTAILSTAGFIVFAALNMVTLFLISVVIAILSLTTGGIVESILSNKIIRRINEIYIEDLQKFLAQ